MTPIFAAAIILGFVALGELVSIWSKARLPGLLVALLGAFIFAQLGIIPSSIADDSLLPMTQALLIGPLLFHMGSLIPLRTMLQQWRSVIISAAGMLCALIVLAATFLPVFGFEYFVAGAGPLAGGIVATSLATEGLRTAGITSSLLILPALILMVQSLPTMPLTNFLLRRYAIKLRDSGKLATAAQPPVKNPAGRDQPAKLVTLPQSLNDNQLFVLFLVFAGGSAATFLSTIIYLPMPIMALLLGIVSTAIGLTPTRALERGGAFGLAMAATIALVMGPLLKASMADVLLMLIPMLLVIVLGGAGIMLGGFITTKLLRWEPLLGMPVALTAMYGFPADYLLTAEVSRSVGRNDEEREKLLETMLPPMLVGGFTSVSTGSVLVTSVLVSLL